MRVYSIMRGRAMWVYGTMRGRQSLWHHYVKVGAVMVTDDPMLAMRSHHDIQNLMNKDDEQGKKLNQTQQSTLPIASTSQNQQPKLHVNGNL